MGGSDGTKCEQELRSPGSVVAEPLFCHRAGVEEVGFQPAHEPPGWRRYIGTFALPPPLGYLLLASQPGKIVLDDK